MGVNCLVFSCSSASPPVAQRLQFPPPSEGEGEGGGEDLCLPKSESGPNYRSSARAISALRPNRPRISRTACRVCHRSRNSGQSGGNDSLAQELTVLLIGLIHTAQIP